jgi:predicted methyltransferase
MQVFLVIALLLCTLPMSIFADSGSSTNKMKIQAAIESPRRASTDTLRDKNRLPLETLTFLGLKDDMTVLELLPGNGWYTKILAPVLEEKGKLYVCIAAESTFESLHELEGFQALSIVPFDDQNFIRPVDARRVGVPEFSFGLEEIDLALTFRNLHNFDEEGRNNINRAVFLSLKSGGLYGVIDHTRRHMQANDDEVWRRLDPVKMIKEIEAAGFQFIDYSDLHYHPDDGLNYEVGRQSVRGNTDRFTLLFKKP